ncbi:hypothetical protein E4O05_03510 [Treponema sp. OMZ 787]|uniref:hypothetical protein n=1 Tax=Treponema sp. OMZ 787 TaxID=2563669 RepID=UPI0020A31FAB|nr:hypothetical protein [Treponema sp. OMZ 787]UTC62977.1 hypothetical protein E4O05_03510 [Treponema sp. OMZ 787]
MTEPETLTKLKQKYGGYHFSESFVNVYNPFSLLENAEMDEHALQDYRPDMNNPVPILFQSGYLTLKEYDKEFQLYKLGFPNDEVKYGFLDNLVPALLTALPQKKICR